nr:hypothetical protein FFPRI1PSEUD_23900 [Pseudomonas sp. FFPRI_1]
MLRRYRRMIAASRMRIAPKPRKPRAEPRPMDGLKARDQGAIKHKTAALRQTATE